MKIVMTPNPYRDRNFKYVEQAANILHEAGVETSVCLPFDVDKGFELPKNLFQTRRDPESHLHPDNSCLCMLYLHSTLLRIR